MSETTLFSPLAVGANTLQHRVVMAPLTRMRAHRPDNVPTPLMAEYYAQRATPGGLLISEATQVTPEGQGYPDTPGIHSAEQVAGWKRVTDAVHAKGGLMFLQLWHVGRVSHSSFQPGGALPVAPSAVKIDGQVMNNDYQKVPYETPRALDLAELPGILDRYEDGARNAKAAGFDGVEVHGANGYLLDQFLRDGTNQREDSYGGSIENRARLLLEAVDRAIAVFGADKVGVRLSPFGKSNAMFDSDPVPLFRHVARELDRRGIAYLHLIEERHPETNAPDLPVRRQLRDAFRGPLIAAHGFDRESALAAIADGSADAVAFGKSFIANPDLVGRLKAEAPLNPWEAATFYGGGEKGYTDYPFLETAAA